MAIPKKIHRVWLGGPMPDDFATYERGWRTLHPEWEVRTWGEADLGWLTNRAAFEDAPFLSSKSNVARYEIVLREGGLYVDCDIEPLRAIDDLLEGAELVVSEERPGYYGNELFAASPGHPVVAYAVSELPSSHYGRPDAKSYQRTGPDFWTRCVRRRCGELDLEPRVLPRDQIYPYSWAQPHLRHREFPEAWAAHHWAKSWVQPEPEPVVSARSAVRRATGRAARSAKRSLRRAQQRWDQVEPAASGDSGRSHPPVTYLGGGRLLVTTRPGYPVLAQADDVVVTPALVIDGMHDAAFSAFIGREIGEGDVVVDVGAGIGLHSLRAALAVRETGRVFAFEPDPGLCGLLRRSVAMNRARGLVAEVSVRQERVGASTGAGGGDDDRGERVVALDDALRAVAELSLVRIDVGGAEDEVLAGMADALEQRRVRLLDVVLCDATAGGSWGSLVARLRRLVDEHDPETFTLGSLGERVPIAMDAAVHGDGLQHLLLDFGRHT